GALLEKQRHVQAKCLGGLEVNYQLKLDWGLDGKFAWLRALEDSIDIGRCTPKIIGLVNSVGQQAAGFSEKAEWIDGRDAIASGQRCDLCAIDVHEGVRHHDEPTIRLSSLCGNHGIELRSFANARHNRLNSEGQSGGFEGGKIIISKWRCRRVEQDGHAGDVRRDLFEQLQPLAAHRALDRGEAGRVAAWPGEACDNAAAYRISNDCENDGNGARLFQ